MRRTALVTILLLAVTLPFHSHGAPADGTLEADGVRYELTSEKAVIVGFVPDIQTARIPALFQGLPTCTDGKDHPLGDLEELILEDGITTLEDYQALKSSRIRRVSLPGTLEWKTNDKEIWYGKSWLGFFPWLQELILPDNVSDADFEGFLDWERDAYWMSGYDLWHVSTDYWEENSTVEDIDFRSLTHVRIAPEHPTLYDIDGVVFRKGTDELVACMPARAGVYAVPGGTKSVGKNAFEQCDMLESVSIPRGVTAIGNAAFSGCVSLRTLQLPPTLRAIGGEAFCNCRSLEVLILPDGVRVGPNAFQYATGLHAVYVPGVESVIDPSAFRTSPGSLTVYAPKDTSAYHAAALNNLLWAEIDGDPQRLYDPTYIQTAIVHDMEVNASLPLYMEASEASEVLMEQPVGSTAKVLETLEGWAHVEFYGAIGYMPLTSLRMVAQEDDLERVLQVLCWSYDVWDPTFDIPTGDVPLYTAPARSAPTNLVNVGQRVDVRQRYGTWYMVEMEGETYYIPVEDTGAYSMDMAVPGRLAVVCAKGVGQRAQLYVLPDENSDSMGVYYNGTQVVMVPKESEDAENPYYSVWTDKINGFFHVQVDGQDGFMAEEALSLITGVFNGDGFW